MSQGCTSGRSGFLLRLLLAACLAKGLRAALVVDDVEHARGAPAPAPPVRPGKQLTYSEELPDDDEFSDEEERHSSLVQEQEPVGVSGASGSMTSIGISPTELPGLAGLSDASTGDERSAVVVETTKDAKKGDKTLEVSTTMGFAKGDYILIGDWRSASFKNRIADLGSMILDEPILSDIPAGTQIRKSEAQSLGSSSTGASSSGSASTGSPSSSSGSPLGSSLSRSTPGSSSSVTPSISADATATLVNLPPPPPPAPLSISAVPSPINMFTPAADSQLVSACPGGACQGGAPQTVTVQVAAAPVAAGCSAPCADQELKVAAINEDIRTKASRAKDAVDRVKEAQRLADEAIEDADKAASAGRFALDLARKKADEDLQSAQKHVHDFDGLDPTKLVSDLDALKKEMCAPCAGRTATAAAATPTAATVTSISASSTASTAATAKKDASLLGCDPCPDETLHEN